MMLRTPPPSKRPRWLPPTHNSEEEEQQEQEEEVGNNNVAAAHDLKACSKTEAASMPAEAALASQLVPYNAKGGLPDPSVPNSNHTSLYLAGTQALFEEEEAEEEEEQGAEEEVGWDSLRCSYKCRSMVKSEVLEALDLRERQLLELEVSMGSLKEEMIKKEAENNRLTDGIKELEQELAAKSGQGDALRKQRATEFDQAEIRLRKQLIRCNELQASLQEETRKNAEAELKASKMEAQLNALKAEDRRAADSAARELHRLKDELQKSHQEKEIAIFRLRSELEFERRKVQGAREELGAFQSKYKELEKHAAKILDEKRDLDHQLADALTKSSSKSTTDALEAEVLVRHLRKELEISASDAAEGKRLKQYHANAELLREQLESERQRANRMERALANQVDLELRVKSLETELEAWKEMLHELPNVQCREDVPRRMAELQRDSVAALAKVGEITAKLVELQSTAEEGGAVNQHTSDAIVSTQVEGNDAKDKVMRLERQVSRLTKERDGLKSILASYDEEEAVLVTQARSAAGAISVSTPEKSKQLRIQQLVASLADAQKTIKQLEGDLEKSETSAKDLCQKADLLASNLKGAEDKIRRLEQEGDELRKKVSLLEHKLGCGDFNPAKTKVLRLKEKLQTTNSEYSNPTIAVAPEVELARSLESEDFTNACNRSIEENATFASKVALLEQEITVLRKRETRYKQVFADRIFTFRNACALIFGYEVGKV